jgi:hypothetical protein
MALKDAAVQLAEGGYFVFPCRAGTKIPAIKGYLKAKWTPEQVAKWWDDHPDDNIGLVPELNGLVVVDIDSYKDECNWDKNTLDTMTVRSASGGIHYYFEAEEGARYPAKFGGYEAVDVKHRGFVVVPPSRFDGGEYEWVDDEGAAPAPDWLPTRQAPIENPMATALQMIERGQDDKALTIVEQAKNRIEAREDWIKVGLGLHYEYVDTQYEERARQAWIDWCLRWDSGDPADQLEYEAIKLWDAATSPAEVMSSGRKPYTAGTIIYLLGDATRPDAAVMTDDGPFLIVDGNELLTRDLADIDYLIEDVLIAGGLHSWAGPSGVGKTRWISLLIACLMTGRTDVMGLPAATRPVRTMYFANEERAEDVERRIKATMLVNGLTGGLKPLIRGKDGGTTRLLIHDKGQVTKDLELLDWIADQIRQAEVELVVFDPFNTLGGEEENSAVAVSEVMDALRYITAQSGAAVVFIHHTPKDRSEAPDAMRGDSNAWRGSGAIYSALDMGFTLFPLLPASASTGKDAKAKRRSLSRMQQLGRCGKYIVQDTGKVREGESIPPVGYQFVGHEVRPGGKPIGALKVVSTEMAEREMELAIDGDIELAEQNVIHEWGAVLIDGLGIGRHETTLKAIDDMMIDAQAGGWDGNDKPIASRGRGRKLIDLFSSARVTAGHIVEVFYDADGPRNKKLIVTISEVRR